jgi:hypothetical protein
VALRPFLSPIPPRAPALKDAIQLDVALSFQLVPRLVVGDSEQEHKEEANRVGGSMDSRTAMHDDSLAAIHQFLNKPQDGRQVLLTHWGVPNVKEDRLGHSPTTTCRSDRPDEPVLARNHLSGLVEHLQEGVIDVVLGANPERPLSDRELDGHVLVAGG